MRKNHIHSHCHTEPKHNQNNVLPQHACSLIYLPLEGKDDRKHYIQF